MITNYFIPQNFTTTILKKKKTYIYLSDNFVKLIFPSFSSLTFNKFLNTLTFNNYSWYNLKKFFIHYSILNLEVIKFKGKGFKLTKKNNTLNFLFNFSHIMYFVNNKNILKKINKNKFILISANFKNFQKTVSNLINLRYINTYNLNGLRLKRQIIYKRKGKTITN